MKSRYDYRAIRELRDVMQWTLREVAEKAKVMGLDVTETTIMSWETGATTPDADKLDLLAYTFGVGIERFYSKK